GARSRASRSAGRRDGAAPGRRSGRSGPRGGARLVAAPAVRVGLGPHGPGPRRSAGARAGHRRPARLHLHGVGGPAMTALLDAIPRVFVAPSWRARPEPVAVAAPSAAVCGREAEPLACALALALRARGAAVVCTWAAPAAPATAPPTTAARRLAASMQSRNLSATASGRLVLVRLDDAP